MSWVGKVFGGAFGFLTAGPLGAILGTALGHQFDRGLAGIEKSHGSAFRSGAQERVQMAFFTATFSVMGHISKADGRVSEAEIELARSVMAKMALSNDLRQTAMQLFTEGKSPAFPIDDVLDQLSRECQRRTVLIRMFIEIQLQQALADGIMSPAKERLLLHICDRLRFSRFEFQTLKTIFEAQQRFSGARTGGWQQAGREKRRSSELADAYAVLGLTPAASDADIKRAYRRLIGQHHPDKLVAKGLPEEMMKIATEKTQQIRKAYERIRSARGH